MLGRFVLCPQSVRARIRGDAAKGIHHQSIYETALASSLVTMVYFIDTNFTNGIRFAGVRCFCLRIYLTYTSEENLGLIGS